MSEPVILGLTRDQLHDIHYHLVLTRAAEERLEILLRQGHVKGGVYRSLGQEAGAVGAAFPLRRRTDGTGDVLAQTIRATGAVFLFGGTPLEYFRQYLARATSPTGGREANVHWTDFQRGLVGPVSPLGTMVEVMAGITLSFRMRGEDRVGMVFYGDGASSTGAWHESLNFAAVQRCPLILMVEHNQWAFSTPTTKQTRVESFTEKAPGYGIGAESVDGTDVLAVYEAVGRAAEAARGGEGTRMVELRYYRRKGHAQHDAQEYVDPQELAKWEARDPIDQFRRRMLEEGWATEDEIAALEEEALRVVGEAADQAIEEPAPRAEEALENVYADVRTPVPWTRLAEPDPHAA
ncbi:MAG: thiamine pyrophosphate-dependent dehydrogenase E1 component subunit alpha [Gemmatimonadetes bacterium]|nr:thiamine pyrophosphate-dependent dehydrogenase E1 component subunit alpha [Gemmatimonadota bacterium]